MIVIVDRPGKEAIIEPCEKIDTDTVVFIGHQGILEAITSDRGSQFVNALWERFCELLRSGDSPLPNEGGADAAASSSSTPGGTVQ